jgi:hypothetical protein
MWPYHFLECVGHLLQGGVAVLAEVVDPLEANHVRDAGKVEHITLDARLRRWPAEEGLVLRAVLVRSCDLVAADKHLLRKAAARTVETICAAIGEILGAFTPEECANYFRNSGYAHS